MRADFSVLHRGFRTALVAGCIGGTAFAHVRLQHSNGTPLFWSSPTNIGIVINATGSDDVDDETHFAALRGAIAAWNADTGSSATLVENTAPAQQARTDWEADDIHLLWFDETDASGFFPVGSGTVALTPVWFFGSGVIQDADVLFNGSNFAFTTDGANGAFDVEDVATHEIGHLLGLDHSGWAGATMYPYVDPTVILHRSPSLDDVRGLRDAYPSSTFASISGTIRRLSDNSIVASAHVVARDSVGRSTAGALANNSGVFALRGLEAGDYELWATPLDQPVSAANLGGSHTVHVDFESTSLGSFTVAAAQSLPVGNQLVEPDVALALGRNTDVFPLRCIAGTTTGHTLRGTGLAAGSTLVASDPTITIGSVLWFGTLATFQVTVPAGAERGHADLLVTNPSSERSLLPGAIEITPADPVVTGVVPSSGGDVGGTSVTISGSGFAAGSRVAIGPRLYLDGAPGGCVVADANTITLTTLATTGGVYDVVVIDPSGVEGREQDAFEFADVPVVDSLFPIAGNAAGGTQIVLRGSEFVSGCVVRIDGVQQTQVTFDNATRLVVITNAGVPGGPYVVEVENPGGGVATAAFSYAFTPDPTIGSLDPPSGSSAGGETIVINGTGFTPASTVRFGANADTGQGGTAATTITFVDAQTLEVVTPASSSGAQNVLVLNQGSGQAVVGQSAFTFTALGGGGGGGCSVAPLDTPRDPLAPLSGGGWLLATFALLWLRSRRTRRTPVLS